jgi:uncharacterized membrane protein
LWFWPAWLVAGSAVLALVLLRIDAQMDGSSRRIWWLFSGNAQSARVVLSVVAGSLITVVAVAFSVTTVAMQQASTQYSPRILRNFTRDRGNQIVLGSYIATFVFCLLVLRRVRETSEGVPAFVPSIAITTAVALALVSFGLLVYFIHHVTRALQLSVILSTIGGDLRHELERRFPKPIGRASVEPLSSREMLESLPPHPDWQVREIRSEEIGYIRIIDQERITAAAREQELQAAIVVAVGEFVQRDQLLARLASPELVSDSIVAKLRAAFSTDVARTAEQDPLFAIQQLVDIALKALSPSTNDSTTAMQCLDQLGASLGLLLERELPEPSRDIGRSRVVFTVPSIDEFVSACFASIRRSARAELRVSKHLIAVLHTLVSRVEAPGRLAVLRHAVDELDATLCWETFTSHERAELRRDLSSLAARLSSKRTDHSGR